MDSDKSLALLTEIRDLLRQISETNSFVVERLDSIDEKTLHLEGIVERLTHESRTETLDGIRNEPSIAEELGHAFTRSLDGKLNEILARLPE
jgi:hypothetical protein